MAIHKLKNAGEELTLDIVTAEVVMGQYGEQAKFTDDNGDILFVPSSSVERQLDRCGVAEITDLSGKSIHFSRAANTKTPGAAPYWDLDKAQEGDKKTAPASNGKAKLLPNETGHEDYHEHHETGAPPSVKVNASVPIPHTGILLPEAPSFDALVTKYGECLDAVSELLHKRNMKLDPQAYTAAVATLFISRTQKNL